MRRLAIYPGTFDPLTNGHLDVIKRSAELFDNLIVAVAKNSAKSPLFSLEDRIEMLGLATRDFSNVSCVGFDNLLADFAKQNGARVLIRGLRVMSDFEYELQMGYANASLNTELETIYFMPSLKNAFISSSIVRNILEYGGKISHIVPHAVFEYILSKGKPCI
ncbi:pantetheine-phosphate adenylyltransferase [Helicobacter mustelae]|uniref:Phosphopantetheine adenylyltransferase n=1 Tax=Helicobacter mustelae (strain ATCC 43772 / CCUG 25715 / CIP 103759 / LMG 18044 / NCTC 12198 / R85-136P) TaxID=679897 RepID=D3UGB8_HELM1|nr:pantetheine-phosphate adenylyltransferase [Helicobacter mustelae]CBG39539.1 Putative Phosphopantetheine adenylyltransferase [Helicobacter mustelae 12198]SQH71051.1 phosphopantetheine adenylyltransferase [Helicobacter mustelae]STP12180.1 phosphopantetheine adenylyltransferase [Helicobacter mustelae]